MPPSKRWRALLENAFPATFEEPPEAPRRGRLFALGALAVLLLFGCPLYSHLGDFDLDNDEAIYAHAALSIVQHGAWLSPWSSPGDGPFLEKPPLALWVVALGIEAGLPESELGLRFASPVFGILGLLYLYALGWRAGRLAGGLAAAATLFLFEPLLFDHGLRSVTMDAALLLSYCGGAFHLAAGMRRPFRDRRGRLHFLAATLFFTFGFLVKFVAALFLPLAAGIALLAAPEGRCRLLLEWRLAAAGGGLFLFLAAPWFVYQHLQQGAFFWRILLGQHVIERFTHSLDPGHLHPFPFYFATLWANLWKAGSAGWVLLGLLGWGVATARRRSFFGVFVLAWAIVPLLLISFGTSKLAHYAYPFLPPLGIVAGYFLHRLMVLVRGAFEPPRWRGLLAAFLVLLGPGLRPAKHYLHLRERFGDGGNDLMRLAVCLSRGNAATLVDQGRYEPLVFVHAFLSDGIYHPIAFYSRRGATLQQLDQPDDKLLFFRLYLPPHQAATVVSEPLWAAFRERLADPELRAAVVEQATGLGAEDEARRLLADPAALPEPPFFTIAGTRYFLPGDYASCMPDTGHR